MEFDSNARRRYTDGTYLRDNPDWHEYGSRWKARKIAEGLARHGIEPQTLAEVGCGVGGVIASLAQRMPNVSQFRGYDISPQAIERALPKAHARLDYVCGDFLELDSRYDVVMAIDVYEHVEDYFAFLRALRTRGTYHVFHVPLELSCYLLVRHRSLLSTRRRAGHLHFYWKDLALESLEDCGYRVLSATYTSPPGEPQPDLDLPPVRSREATLVSGLSRLVYRFSPDTAIRLFGGSSLLVVAEPR